jgi:hypothetical protein
MIAFAGTKAQTVLAIYLASSPWIEGMLSMGRIDLARLGERPMGPGLEFAVPNCITLRSPDV